MIRIYKQGVWISFLAEGPPAFLAFQDPERAPRCRNLIVYQVWDFESERSQAVVGGQGHDRRKGLASPWSEWTSARPTAFAACAITS